MTPTAKRGRNRVVAGVAALMLVGMGSVAMAQQAVPSPAVTYIHAGRLMDRPGSPVRGQSTIVVTGDRITAVQDGFQTPADAGVRVIDLRTSLVMPGFIDSHVHLDSDAGGNEALIEGFTKSDAAMAFQALANAQKTLRAGFTTVRNLGDGSGATLALRDAGASGQVLAPRIVDAGQSISATAGHMDWANGLRDDLREHAHAVGNTCDGADDCRRAVRVQVSRGADVIKLATTGGVNSRIGAGLGKQMFEDEAKAIVETARLSGKRVAVHAHGADGIRLALSNGVDSIEYGTILDDETIAQWAKSKTYYVPTLSTVNGYLERLAANGAAYSPEVRAKIEWRIGITGKSLERLYPKGVRIALGTDAGVSKHGRNADEFELMVKHGMPPVEAIKAGTVNAADLLGLANEIGTLEPGMSADIVAVKGDPIADITVLKGVHFVMARGKVARD